MAVHSNVYPGNSNDGLIWSHSDLRGEFPPTVDGSPIAFTVDLGGGNLMRFPPVDLNDDGFPLSLYSMKPFGATEADPLWMRVFDKVLVCSSWHFTPTLSTS